MVLGGQNCLQGRRRLENGRNDDRSVVEVGVHVCTCTRIGVYLLIEEDEFSSGRTRRIS